MDFCAAHRLPPPFSPRNSPEICSKFQANPPNFLHSRLLRLHHAITSLRSILTPCTYTSSTLSLLEPPHHTTCEDHQSLSTEATHFLSTNQQDYKKQASDQVNNAMASGTPTKRYKQRHVTDFLSADLVFSVSRFST